MNGRFIDEEMHRFEAEIHQQPPNGYMGPRMFVPPQMRSMHPPMGMPIHYPGMNRPPMMPSGMMQMNRFPQRPMTQSIIAAPPRPSSAVISAPAQTITSKSSNADDDDIEAMLKKYETEVKKEIKKSSLMPTQVAQHQRKTQNVETVKKAAASVSTNKTPVAAPPQASTSSATTTTSGPGVPSGTKAPPSATIGDETIKKAKKQKRIVRTGGGQVWEDETLKEWDSNDFRLFAGDLGNDVTDEVLVRTFSRYPSFVRAKVIRDKKSNKTKGFGFVSFKDPSDFTRAMKELNGKYVGSRPIKLRKSNWKDRNIEVVRQKQKVKQQMGYKW